MDRGIYIPPPLPWEPKKVRGCFGHFCHLLNPHIRHSLALRLQSVSDLEPVTKTPTSFVTTGYRRIRHSHGASVQNRKIDGTTP